MSSTFIASNLIIFFAFLIRSTSGFGGALLSIPLLALFLELGFVVPAESSLEVMLSLLLLPSVWKSVEGRHLAWMSGGALVGSVIGIKILQSFANRTLKTILGITIILVAFHLLRGVSNPKHSAGKPISDKWGVIAGIAGGILGGMFGTSGPAYLFYLAHRQLTPTQIRATLIALFALEYTWRLVGFVYTGLYTIESFRFAASLAPALILATVAGHALQGRLNAQIYRWGVSGLLFLSGVLCIFT